LAKAQIGAVAPKKKKGSGAYYVCLLGISGDVSSFQSTRIDFASLYDSFDPEKPRGTDSSSMTCRDHRVVFFTTMHSTPLEPSHTQQHRNVLTLLQNLRICGALNVPMHLHEVRQRSNLTFNAESEIRKSER
jgi:hypothetical protein